jgi:hypothetical protein
MENTLANASKCQKALDWREDNREPVLDPVVLEVKDYPYRLEIYPDEILLCKGRTVVQAYQSLDEALEELRRRYL